MTLNSLILASASPRRRQLLDQIGVRHQVHAAAIDESPRVAEAPAAYVERLAREKAEAVWNRLAANDRPSVLGADTTVALGNAVLGKPASREEGVAMLQRLSGRTHQVYTAVALRTPAGCACRVSVSEVTFRQLTDAECAAYWETGEPFDKAGGYAVQGLAAVFVTHIAGSYSGIMGLPLAETAELLATIGWGIGKGLEAGGWRLGPEAGTSEPRPSVASDLQPTACSLQPSDLSKPQSPAPSLQPSAGGAAS